MPRPYSEAEAELNKPLSADRIRHRDAGRGRQVPYIEGFDAIARANEIFGFDGWSYRVEDVGEIVTSTGRLLYRAVVTVEALGVRRTDVGSAIVEVRRDTGEDSPDGHDMAIKGAVTDALKRGLRSFGAQFGNDLYEKQEAAPRREARPTQQREATVKGSANVGEFYAWAWQSYKLNKSELLKRPEVAAAIEANDLGAARKAIEAAVA